MHRVIVQTLKVRGFEGSRVRGFEGSRVRRNGSSVRPSEIRALAAPKPKATVGARVQIDSYVAQPPCALYKSGIWLYRVSATLYNAKERGRE